jgi:hypothetical protein
MRQQFILLRQGGGQSDNHDSLECRISRGALGVSLEVAGMEKTS